MTVATVAGFAAGGMIGAAATPQLTTRGLRKLGADGLRRPRVRWVTVAAGAASGTAAIAATYRSATWVVAPALLAWACTLAAAATCDALTQRIPTPLVRRGGAVTALLLAAGLSARQDWHGLAATAASTSVAALVLLLAWRFAGAGFGDVRLATLGGLGLGHATERGIMMGLGVFCAVTLAQALIALARGGDRHTTIAYGPALAVAFLTAAA